MVPQLYSPELRWKSGAFTQIQFQGEIEGRSIRTGRYDHQTDAHQFTNLATRAEHAATLGKLWGASKAGRRHSRLSEPGMSLLDLDFRLKG